MLRKTLSILAAAWLTACATIVDAGTLAEVSVVDRTTGQTLHLYRHHGRYYVEGKPGDRYAVRLRNHGGGRILTVLSVDGVNVVTGQTAAAHQSGYVLDPWSSAEIAGWRKDMTEVAAFYFTALADSYAARTGRADNVGVIGVAIYQEYVEPPPPPSPAMLEAPARPQSLDQAAAARNEADAAGVPGAAPSTAASDRRARAAEKLGTGHGERIHAPTHGTEFRRAGNSPGEVITIYYDSRANLIAQGVIPAHSRMPQAFPDGGFVPDPS